MGRGTSKVGGGSGSTAAINAPFSATDWRTWPIGTEVTISEDDVVVGDGVEHSRRNCVSILVSV